MQHLQDPGLRLAGSDSLEFGKLKFEPAAALSRTCIFLRLDYCGAIGWTCLTGSKAQ